MHVVLTGNFRAEEGHHETHRNTGRHTSIRRSTIQPPSLCHERYEYDLRDRHEGKNLISRAGQSREVSARREEGEEDEEEEEEEEEERLSLSRMNHRLIPERRRLSIDISRMEPAVARHAITRYMSACVRVRACVCHLTDSILAILPTQSKLHNGHGD